MGSGENEVSLKASIDNLNDDVFVCEPDDKSVFWGIAKGILLSERKYN